MLPAGPDIDLVAMARWGLRALAKNPRPHLDYACRFHMSLLAFPPAPLNDAIDSITDGDTDNRLDWAFGYMREMTGEDFADDVAAGVRRRVLGYLREDGMCWTLAHAGSQLDGIFANPWSTGKLLISLAEDYRRSGDAQARTLCRRMFEALRDRAEWVNGRAYYAGGNSYWNAGGWAITDGSPYHPAMLVEAVTTYYEQCRDEEALAFVLAFAEGEMANDQWNHAVIRDTTRFTPEQEAQRALTSSIALWPTAPPEADLSVRPDGSFDHHSHMRGHQGWGMAHLGALTGHAPLIAWSKRLLDFFLSRGTDYGWIPESVTYPRRSETCAVADVLNMAEWMAKAGYPEYWDVVERFTRNYLREAQFFFSPEYEAQYRALHPGADGERDLALARDFEGAFQGAMGLADRCFTLNVMDMMGCCVPEGMRALYAAWRNTVIDTVDAVRVNLCFDCDAPAATVVSSLPGEGRLTVTPKVSKPFLLRPPTWANRDSIRVQQTGRLIPIHRDGAYVRVVDAKAGEPLTLTFSLPAFIQRQSIPSERGMPARDITIHWLGNTVCALESGGAQLPLYRQVPRILPPLR